MKKTILHLTLLLCSITTCMIQAHEAHLANNTPYPIDVQVLTVCSSSNDLTHRLLPFENKVVGIPNSCCFSRVKVNGEWPDNNWKAGAKCGRVIVIVSKSNGRYSVAGSVGSGKLLNIRSRYLTDEEKKWVGSVDRMVPAYSL